ncbi:GNAT family N-acetyltransferase [Pollutibacter soli]|uniref:GNAT family N-acetyltransferase n=1 Tax=Pollutibacter soli TaxID=3034157 RepID=UPI0030138A65
MITNTAVIREAKTDDEIIFCWEVVEALRPHLEKENLISQVKEMMKEGYRMFFVEAGGKAVCFAGFREMYMLYCGKIIYIDDLSTLPDHRGKGYAGMLLNHIHQLAKDLGKAAVHLDSGHHRHTAHRLYLNKGYVITSHHFANTFTR